HSPAYFAAAGAADGEFSWQHAGAAKIADPAIHRLIDLVRVGDPPTEDAARFRQGAKVTIRTVDGRESTSTVHVPKGADRLGVAWSDVDTKYRTLMPASGLSAQAIEASLAMIHGIGRAAQVSPLVQMLQTAAG